MWLLLCLSLSAPDAAGDRPVPPALLAIAEKMRAVRSLRVNLQQEKTMAVFGEVMRSRGTLLLARPRRLAMDLEGPGGTTLVIDGDHMAIRYKALRKTERFDLSRDRRAKAIADHLFLLLDADPVALGETYELELRGESPVQLRLLPKPEALRQLIAHVDVRFDARGLVSELVMREGNGDETRWRFDDPRINVALDDAAFRVQG